MNQYPLPEGWRWAKLGDVLEYLQYGVSQKSNWEKKGYPILGMGNIEGGKLIISDLKYIELPRLKSDRYILKKGDILINRTNSAELVGKSAVFDLEGDCVFASYLIRLRVKASEANPYFVNFGINSFIGRDYVSRVARRAIGQVNINSKEIGEMPIPLCSLSEQRRIAAKIQELMQDVDRARAACEKQIEAAKALHAAFLREVFESEDAKKWEKKKLTDLSSVISKGTTPTTYGHSFVPFGIPFLRAEDVVGGPADFSGVTFHITKETHDFLSRSKLYSGDLLITIAGSLGRVGYVPKDAPEANCNQAVAFARIDPTKALVDFLCYALQVSDILLRFAELKVGGTIQNLNLEQVRSIAVPLPSLSEQEYLTQIINEKRSGAEKLRLAIQNEQLFLNSMSQAILRKAFVGEL